MPHRNKIRIPQEVREDKPENERKYKISGSDWQARVNTMSRIFNHVALCHDHFVTRNMHPHTDGYHPDLLSSVEMPVDIISLRTRYYWAGKNLKGYRPTDKLKGEVRTEYKEEKDAWQQVLKLGSSGGKTLSRGEFKRYLDQYGVNLSVFKDRHSQAIQALGKGILKPLVRLQGQTKKIFYHPDGRNDVLLEIKFDKVKGEAFDAYSRDIIEIEVEVKRRDKKAVHETVEDILDRTERELFKHFADDLQPIYESKVYDLFKHLDSWRMMDQKGFEKAFRTLPRESWTSRLPKSALELG